jgi:serine/threonine protein kinase/predicted GTPase
MVDGPTDLKIEGIANERLVRRGDHTELYQAVQTQFGRKVAIKVYTAAGSSDTAIRRFERECELMGELGAHPNVVTYFASGVRRQRPFVVSEWFDDGTFSDVLARGLVVEWDLALTIGVKVAGALESAHRAGLIHRKFKPQDLFLSAFGEPLVGDFHVDPGEGSRSGDPFDIMVHAAPELFRGSQGDPRVDVYSLASVIFTLISGRPPFQEDPDEPLVRIKGRALAGIPRDLREIGVPASVFAVLAWGLHPSPDQRPQTALEFGRAMQAALAAAGRAGARLLVRPHTEQDRRLPPPTMPAAALSLIIPPVAPPASAAAASTPPAAPASPSAPAVAVSESAASAPMAPPDVAPAAAGPVRARRASELVMTPSVLLERVRSLLLEAKNHYTEPSDLSRLDALERRLDEPLRVAIAGKLKAGKSTLLNGLVGEELAPTNARECTKVVTWYVNGLTYAASLQLVDGRRLPTPIGRSDGAIDVDLQNHPAADIERIIVEWPSSSLSSLSLIDTPGVESSSTDVSARTHRFVLPDEDTESQADAVVYLMRHLHPTDIRFLEAFQDVQVGRTNPINAIGVLSRADELAGAQDGALESAAQVAARYRNTPQVRKLCQTVVPVAGLLAQAAAVMQQSDYNLLTRLAGLSGDERELLLATADRFVDKDVVGQVVAADREHLIRRFGLFGVRTAIGAIVAGEVTSAQQLSTLLFDRSGLSDLRRLLMTQFAARRDVLKAQAVLLALGQRLRATPPRRGGDELFFELERLRTEAHVFNELELFGAVRSGAVEIRPAEVDAVERLLGAEGYSTAQRLSLDPGSSAETIRAELDAQINKWRARAENPLSDKEQVDAAQVLVRTCEGMLASMDVV